MQKHIWKLPSSSSSNLHTIMLYTIIIHLLFLLLSAIFSPIIGVQFHYDFKTCSSTKINSCHTSQTSCQSYLLYRANPSFRNVSSISKLFQADRDAVLQLNEPIPDSDLELGTEVIVPITCACVSGEHYQGNATYVAAKEESISEIACVVFQGLVSSTTDVIHGVDNGGILVPIECACPGKDLSLSSGTPVKYFLTYRFKTGDDCRKVADKFSVPVTDIWEVNALDYRSTVFANTTALVPLTKPPTMAVSLEAPPPDETQLPEDGDNKSGDGGARVWSLYAVIGGITSLLVGSLVFVAGFVVCAKGKKNEGRRRHRSVIESPVSPCLSPEVLTEIKYYSLVQYSIDELRSATMGFDEGSKIDDDEYGGRFYKGKINGGEILIKQMRSEEIRAAIDAHSKINHKNILNPVGVCYKNNCSKNPHNYLVFDYPTKGCLRQCLASQETLSWRQRKQIAFDIATGIHYLHYCIFPSGVRTRISTRNVFVTENWRAKIVNTDSNEISTEDEIFLFGTTLLEIVSGRVAVGSEEFGDSVSVLEKVKGFVDGRLREDEYPLAEALCLAVLGKACVEDDPVNRPSIDDIIKVLATII